ncbi:MAG: alpha-amylase [Chlorobi bacterium]|nr:alpha-amylase [Chlorobiota bacterium]
MPSLSPLETLYQRLKELERERGGGADYLVPGLWTGASGGQSIVAVNPFRFFRHCIETILSGEDRTPEPRADAGEWSREAVVYNMFIRHTAAFDHNGDGRVSVAASRDGFRETGTFLKAIALLPYIARLKCDTIHLLPVASIGRDGRKGSLGSPFAVRNPYMLEETLAEPALALDTNTQFAAFVEAAHRMGMRVVLEFVLRTTAKDSTWIPEHPGWFYWIREDIPDRGQGENDPNKFGSPLFGEDEIRNITERVLNHNFDDLPEPPLVYRNMFGPVPVRVEESDGRYIGYGPRGERLRIPGAFADWPPLDAQPPWTDVTYLRLYDAAGFNYMAYNTLRMYDRKLAREENIVKDLWEKILGIIPHYQKVFAIDGVMIDMGHALPGPLKARLVESTRNIDPSFALWEENFDLGEQAQLNGSNVAIGCLWKVQHSPRELRRFLRLLATRGTPLPFFCTPETHNTHRAAARSGGMQFSRLCWIMNCFLPGVPFIHQGFELGTTLPVNTGLDFSPEEIKALPPSKLPLYSEAQLPWQSASTLLATIPEILDLRNTWKDAIQDPSPHSFDLLQTSHDKLIAFQRTRSDQRRHVLVVCNFDFESAVEGEVTLPADTTGVKSLLTGEMLETRDGILRYRFQQGEGLICEY